MGHLSSPTLDPAVQIHLTFLNQDKPDEVAERTRSLIADRSGLVIASPADTRIQSALQAAQTDGLPIVQVVTRCIASADFVGNDNRAVGQMAGRVVSRLNLSNGTVVALCHGEAYRGHRDPIAGVMSAT